MKKFSRTKKNQANQIDKIVTEATPKETAVSFEVFGERKEVTKNELLDFTSWLIPLYHEMIFNYLQLVSILWIPILSALSFLFFFRKRNNFAEHMTFNSYVFSHALFIFVITSPLYWFFPSLSQLTLVVTLAAMLFYVVYSYMDFFRQQNGTLIKTGMVMVIGLSTYATMFLTVILSLAAYLVYQNLDKL